MDVNDRATAELEVDHEDETYVYTGGTDNTVKKFTWLSSKRKRYKVQLPLGASPTGRVTYCTGCTWGPCTALGGVIVLPRVYSRRAYVTISYALETFTERIRRW